jgi:hypothetical protein
MAKKKKTETSHVKAMRLEREILDLAKKAGSLIPDHPDPTRNRTIKNPGTDKEGLGVLNLAVTHYNQVLRERWFMERLTEIGQAFFGVTHPSKSGHIYSASSNNVCISPRCAMCECREAMVEWVREYKRAIREVIPLSELEKKILIRKQLQGEA